MDIIELTMLGQTISQQYGVEVRFVGPDEAATCGKEQRGSMEKFDIQLPYSNNDDANVYYRGYIDHEVGHVRFTDWNYSTVELLSTYGRVGQAVFNVFEDVHIERKMGEIFPGAKINLRNLARKIFDDDECACKFQGCVWDACLGLALFVRRSTLDAKIGEGRVGDFVDELRAFGMSYTDIDKLMEIAQQTSNSTRESAQQAADFCRVIKYGAQQQQQQGQGDDGAQGGRTGDSSGDVRDVQERGGDCTLNATCAASVSDNVGMGIQRNTPHGGLNSEYLDFCVLRSTQHYDTVDVSLRSRRVDVDQRIYGNLSRAIPPLLQSLQYRPAITGRRGKLDGRMLHRSAVADDRVFLKRAERLEHKVEVGLLMDYSGSMDGMDKYMNQGAFAMCKMLKSLPGVRAFMLGFREDRTCMLVSPEDTVSGCMKALYTGGSTPTAAAVLRSSMSFTYRADVRKLLFIFTDGKPDDATALTTVLASVQKHGVEVYGVGMQGMDLSVFFDDRHWICVQDMAKDFTPKLADMMRKALVKAVAA